MDWTLVFQVGLQIVAFILQRVNASQETIARFQALVIAAKDDGLISVQASDKFTDIHDRLMKRFEQPKP